MSRSRSTLALGGLSALFSAGYGVMFTMLDDFRDEYGISPKALGAVVAIGFLSSFLAQVLLAPQADRGHARLMVYVGMACNVAGLLGMAFGRTAVALLIARLVMGIGAGIAQPAIRRIVILSSPESVGDNLGFLLSADVGGFAFGPAISAVLTEPYGIAAPFLVIAAATIVCVPLIMRINVDERADSAGRRFAFDLFRSRAFTGTVLMGSAVFLMIGTFDSLWVLVLDDLGAADWIANLGIVIFSLPFVLFGAVGGRMAQRVGPLRLASTGLIIGAACLITYGHLPTGAAMMAVGVLHSINDGLTVSSTGVAIGMAIEPERQASAQGMLGGIQTLVGGLTALAAGWMYEDFGRAWAFGVSAAVMVLLVAIGAAMTGLRTATAPAVLAA
jgi:MFS family permease